MLQYLLNKEGVAASSELQEALQVSRRTIVNYVNEMNQEYGGLIVSSKNGYKLTNPAQAYRLLHQDENLEELGYESRKKELLYRMILAGEKIEVEEGAASLYVSAATLQSDLLKLKQELKQEELSIKTKNNYLFLVGPDQAKRKYILSLLREELKSNSFCLDSFQNYFHQVNFEQIKQIVSRALDQNDAFLDDYSLLNYVLHLCILMESVTLAEAAEFEEKGGGVSYPPRILRIVGSIHEQLSEQFPVTVPVEKILNESFLMSTRIVAKDYNQLTYQTISDILGNETIVLVDKIVFNINKNYGVNLREDDFKVRFAWHIGNLLTRVRNHIFLPENQFVTIQEDYPFLYFIAKYTGSLICDEAKVELNETEILYIALHLGVLIEETQNYPKRINCAIVIYDYYNSGKLLFQKLSGEINGLYLMSIVNSYAQLKNLENLDLIITTLPVNPALDIPSVKIRLIPTQNDYAVLNKKINELRHQLSTKEIERNIRRLFKKELFYAVSDWKEREEVLGQMCWQMEAEKCVDGGFIKMIRAREEIASTAHRGIALPHPLNTEEECIRESCVSALISRTPVKWGEETVNFVFLIALKKDDRILFKEVFEMIITAFDHAAIRQQVLSCADYEQFVSIMTHVNDFIR